MQAAVVGDGGWEGFCDLAGVSKTEQLGIWHWERLLSGQEDLRLAGFCNAASCCQASTQYASLERTGSVAG